MTVCRLRRRPAGIDVPPTAARMVDGELVWELDLDLTDDQADGITCLVCAGRYGAMVPIGNVLHPGHPVGLFAHENCVAGASAG